MKKEIDMPSRSRDKILSLISVLEYLRKEGEIYDEKGMEMAGLYWDGIKKDIAAKCHGDLSRGNNPNKPNGLLSVLFMGEVDSYIAECYDKLEDIENRNYDRWLNNEHKKVHIRYTRWAYIISIISLVISVLSALGATKGIVDWLQGIFVSAFCT